MLIFAIVNKRLHLIACSVIACGILLLARQPFKAARRLSCKVWVRHPCWFSQSWISVRLCRSVPVKHCIMHFFEVHYYNRFANANLPRSSHRLGGGLVRLQAHFRSSENPHDGKPSRRHSCWSWKHKALGQTSIGIFCPTKYESKHIVLKQL